MKYPDFRDALDAVNYHKIERLYSCQAEIYQSDEKALPLQDYPIILMSYTAVVAVYLPHNGRLYVFDYYSPTVSQHLSKFEKRLNDWFHDVTRINLYHRKRNKNGSYLVYDDEVEV